MAAAADVQDSPQMRADALAADPPDAIVAAMPSGKDAIPELQPEVARPKRRRASRSEVLRASGFFVFGLGAGAMVVWNATESAWQPPRIPAAPPGVAGIAAPESAPRSWVDYPIGSVGQVPSVPLPAKSVQASVPVQAKSVRTPAPAQQRRVVASSRAKPSPRATPSQPERRAVTNRGPARQAQRGARGSLLIDSHPQRARVSLDGRMVGSTPLALHDVPIGTHTVRVEADGYQVWAWTARVVANQRSMVTAKLFKDTMR